MSNKTREYQRRTALTMRQYGSSLGTIAKFLGVDKARVRILLVEAERCEV